MTSPMNCELARELFFELRHGRIEQPQRDAFDLHLKGCTACQEYVEKLDSMLDEAMLWEPADGLAIDKDDLFGSILGGIEAEKNGASSLDKIASGEDIFDDEPLELHSKQETRQAIPWLRLCLAAAALIIATMSWPLLIVEFVSGESDALFKELAATSGEVDADFSQDRLDLDIPFALTQEPLFAGQTQLAESVRVLPGDDARWALEADGEGWEVVAYRGQILVEFLPREDETLRFRYPGGQGDVVGTVFYLDADAEEVGVVDGEVNVESDDGTKARLQSRNVFRQNQIHDFDPEKWEQVTAAIDPEVHRQKLAELRDELREKREAAAEEASHEETNQVQPVATETARPAQEQARIPGPAGLRLNAEQALRQRDFEEAATHYEALLDLLPNDDRSAGSVRLDLARLYHRHLQDSERTVGHLRYFISTWPNDSVTPQAIAELCRLVDDPNKESLCRRR